MHAHHPERQVETSHAVTAVRRLHGPVADELFVLSRPAGIGDAARQAEAVYRGLGDVLAAEGLGIDALVAETVFCRRVRDDGNAARAARSRVLGNAAQPVTTVIGQPPLDGLADLEIAAVAVRPRSRDASTLGGETADRLLVRGSPTCRPGSSAWATSGASTPGTSTDRDGTRSRKPTPCSASPTISSRRPACASPT